MFVQPILSIIWVVLLWLGTHFFYNTLDSIYLNAALGHREWVIASIVLMALIITPLVIISGWISKRLSTTKKAEARPPRTTPTWKKVFDIGLIFSSPLPCLIVGAFIFIDLQLNTSFDQRIAVLAPKVPDQTIKELRAQWALMASREDYLVLNARLEQLAHDAGITLPKPLLK